MLAEDRLAGIVERVAANGSASVPELAEEFGASASTIRRDLEKLDAARRLVKVHGGATTLEGAHVTRDLPLDERHGLHEEEKHAIAAYAASLIGPDDFVYIDAGSTTEALVRAITETRATYVTDAVNHALALVARGCTAIVLGGELKGATEALVGPDALDVLERYHFTLGFWGTNGVDAARGLTTPDRFEAQIKRVSMAHASHRFVLADASKFDVVASVRFADVADATILTDSVPASAEWHSLTNVMEVPR